MHHSYGCGASFWWKISGSSHSRLGEILYLGDLLSEFHRKYGQISIFYLILLNFIIYNAIVTVKINKFSNIIEDYSVKNTKNKLRKSKKDGIFCSKYKYEGRKWIKVQAFKIQKAKGENRSYEKRKNINCN